MTDQKLTENDLEPRIQIDRTALRRMKITVAMSLSVEEWDAFMVHARKSGGTLVMKIANVVEPVLDRVKKATDSI